MNTSSNPSLANSGVVCKFLDSLEERIFSTASEVNAAGPDPVQFSIDVLGVTPWELPAQVMRSVRDNPRTAVRAGHKVSKSNLAACMAIWWAMGPPGSRVLITASSSSQIRDIIWKELRDIKRQAPSLLPGNLNTMPANGWDLGKGRQIVGRTADDPEGIAGISSPRLLIIADEAPGIEDEIFAALDGNMAGGAHMLLLGNPTRIQGYFFEAFHEQRDIWQLFNIPSTASPNVVADEIVIPGLATKEWVEDRLRAWGPNHPLYKIRVLGEFAETSVSSLFRRDWIEAAFKRHDEWIADGRPGEFLSFGADSASADGPDSCALAENYECGIGSVDVYPTIGPLELADLIEERYISKNRRGVAVVDVLSGPGAADSLKRKGVPCIPYKGSEKTDWTDATGMLHFYNTRSAAYWNLHDGLNPDRGINIMLPRDPAIIRQLMCIEYWETASGKIRITTKDDVKKMLGGSSPDTVDAIIMARWLTHTIRVPAFHIHGG